MGLPTGENLGCGKIFQVLVIRDHVDRSTGTFKVVLPDTESLKNCQQFFVMCVIIEFQSTESAGMESHRVDFTRICLNGENSAKGVVRGVGFYYDRFIWDPVGKDGSGCKCRLESFKGLPSGVGKIPGYTFAGEPGKRNYNIGIVGNETADRKSTRLNSSHSS